MANLWLQDLECHELGPVAYLGALPSDPVLVELVPSDQWPSSTAEAYAEALGVDYM
jgi:hypothetical protein